MKRRIGILLCLFFMSSMAMAQTRGKISGKVVDAKTGEPLVGANVIIEGTSLGAATDAVGDYFIINVRPGIYTVTARMMGYQAINKTEVRVYIDRTIKVDFKLNTAAVEGQAVTVVAEREVIQQDVSSSGHRAKADEVDAVPMVVDINNYIALQSGVQEDEEGIIIRGGGVDQVGLVVDGLPMVDNVHNKPMDIVNLSSIEEVEIIKGGFNAEYGNIRSGMFNIITKSGKEKYQGGMDLRYTVPYQKHRGNSIFSQNNFYMRPYLDPDVCYVGTKNGPWNWYAQQQYPEFEGWNAFSARLAEDDDPTNDLTPEQCRDLFIWQHAAEGSEALGHPHPGKYGDKPDLNLDFNFGGPLPLIGKYLGQASFFASYRRNVEQYALPAVRDNILTQNAMFKVNSTLSSNMKLGIEWMYGLENNAGFQASNIEGGRGIYFPYGQSPMDVYQSMVGLMFDHVLSPRTFYQLRLSRVTVRNDMWGAQTMRDTTRIRKIGSVWVDEQPYGWIPVSGYQYALADRMVIGGVGGGGRNKTKVTTYNVKFDLTSQVDKFNQVKAGFEVTADNYNVYEGEHGLDPTGDYLVDWDRTPIRFGGYIQDKLEFEGMIANLGVRLDYNDPNTNWYTVDPYSPYFSRIFKDQLTTESPTAPAKGHLTISPRLGISHPISDVSKLYFSYGHFYSMPRSGDMYQINYGIASQGIERLGNPSLRMPRTIAYELGYEHEIADMFLLRLVGYYRDVTDQVGDVRYINYDESVNYSIAMNDNYADVRGFELEIRKIWGKWVTGWLNYTYMVNTDGMVGREVQYQDPRLQAIYGLRSPIQEKPIPQPFARGNITFHTPADWGPKLGKSNVLGDWSFTLLGYYNSGDHLTWEPLPPYKLQNNLKWKDQWMFDLRVMKNFSLKGVAFTAFMDIANVFDMKFLTGQGFWEGSEDLRDYLNSLHLPMYGGDKYLQDGRFTEGTDKVGDTWSKDKPYINMPNLDYMAWSVPRSWTLGLRVNF